MSYILKLTSDAIEDIQYLKKTGDKATLRKLATLLKELTEHPAFGTGQPEVLKHNFSGCWSRRINAKHRLVYQIDEQHKTVVVLFASGHYLDK